VFLAIVGEFNLERPDQLRDARVIFESLVENAETEDASGFDPTGSGGLDCMRSQNGESASSQSMLGWSTNTDDTLSSQGIPALDLDDLKNTALGADYSIDLEKLDMEAKEAALIEIFPGLKPFDINWALRKSKGNAGLAIEELLNQVFFDENGGRYRGVEGFSETGANPRPRKGKWKNKKRSKFTNGAVSPSEVGVQPSPTVDSRWDSARRDVDFISSRTRLPKEQVSSMYHSAGASVAATLRAIIAAFAELKVSPDGDHDDSQQVQDLCADFPSIPLEDLTTLVYLARHSPVAAHELAEALVSRSSPSPGAGTPIRLEFRLAPPNLPDLAKTKPKPYAHNAWHPSPDLPNAVPTTLPSAASRDYRSLRDAALEQAAAAWRKSKSDPLMGGAAAYYSSVGRDLDERSRAAAAAEADTLVAAQSSDGVLDLHGVTVREAVRISREKVLLWWETKGSRGDSAEGYKIVIGKGTHSVGGKSKLGPAVGGMLIKEGWKFQARSGALVVMGQVGKR
jgi:hypothetical protein